MKVKTTRYVKAIIPDLLSVGNAQYYEELGDRMRMNNLFVIQACKEPYHRQAVGYTGRSAPKGPEYLMARRDNRLILNLVDAEKGLYIPKELIDATLFELETRINNEEKVFIHCNNGESRAPTIAMLFMLSRDPSINSKSAEESIKLFKAKYYPNYAPNKGIREFLDFYWSDYSKRITHNV